MWEPDVAVGPRKAVGPEKGPPERKAGPALFAFIMVGSFAAALGAIRLWDVLPGRDDLARMIPSIPRPGLPTPEIPTGTDDLKIDMGKPVTVDLSKVDVRGGFPGFRPGATTGSSSSSVPSRRASPPPAAPRPAGVPPVVGPPVSVQQFRRAR